MAVEIGAKSRPWGPTMPRELKNRGTEKKGGDAGSNRGKRPLFSREFGGGV